LEDRTCQFGEKIIDFCKLIEQDLISRSIISQLVRSGTSAGANYLEANGASSKKDFRNKIYICKKEIQETKHWLTMIERYKPELKNKIEFLRKETQELILIFGKIASTLQKDKLNIKNSNLN
jgi:four helix bundle protein